MFETTTSGQILTSVCISSAQNRAFLCIVATLGIVGCLEVINDQLSEISTSAATSPLASKADNRKSPSIDLNRKVICKLVQI